MNLNFSNFNYFDCHTHFFPPPLLNALWHYFETNYWPIYWKDTPESLTHALISNYRITHFLVLNYAHKSGIAPSMNDWTFEFCSAPERKNNAIPFGTIHPDDERKSDEMDRIFDDLGFAGIKLQLMVTDFHIWDKHMDPVYQKIMEYDRILLVHIGTGPTYSNFYPGVVLQCPYLGYKHLRRFMKRFPEMKVIVPHLGAEEYEEMWALTEDFPNLYFDTAMICAKQNPAFDDKMNLINDEQLYEIMDRILFGSDFPNIPYDFRNGVLGWLERDMEHRFYEKIFFGNAEALLHDYL